MRRAEAGGLQDCLEPGLQRAAGNQLLKHLGTLARVWSPGVEQSVDKRTGCCAHGLYKAAVDCKQRSAGIKKRATGTPSDWRQELIRPAMGRDAIAGREKCAIDLNRGCSERKAVSGGIELTGEKETLIDGLRLTPKSPKRLESIISSVRAATPVLFGLQKCVTVHRSTSLGVEIDGEGMTDSGNRNRQTVRESTSVFSLWRVEGWREGRRQPASPAGKQQVHWHRQAGMGRIAGEEGGKGGRAISIEQHRPTARALTG